MQETLPKTTALYTHLGKAIRARRLVLKLTQGELADRLGLGISRHTYISAVENGEPTRLNMSLERLAQFAGALSCSASDLLDSVSSNTPTLSTPTPLENV